MKKLLVFLAVFALTGSVQAVHMPLFQSVAEYRAILEHPELYKHLGSFETIQRIERVENDLYQLETEDKIIFIEVITLEDKGIVGPRQFRLEFYTVS